MKKSKLLLILFETALLSSCGNNSVSSVSSVSPSSVSSIVKTDLASVKVDPSSQDGELKDGVYNFKTIQNAEDFLNKISLVSSTEGASAKKEAVKKAVRSVSGEYIVKGEMTTLVTKCSAQDYATALPKASTEEYKCNNVFSLMPGIITDSGAKSMTIDGVSTKIAGRIKSAGIGSITSKSIKIDASKGAGTLRFFAQGANSTDTSRTWTIAKEDGTEVFTSDKGVSPSAPEEDKYTFTEAGIYYLYSKVNGINFYYLDLTQEVELGSETGIEINAKNVKKDYLIGDSIDTTGLDVEVVYSSGIKKPLDASAYTVDASGFDNTKANTSHISIKYKDFAAQSYDVTIHSVKGVKVYTTPTMVSGNQKKVVHFSKVYKLNETLDTSAVVVKAVADNDAEMLLASSSYSFNNVDMSKAGSKKLTVSYASEGKTYSEDIDITVIDTSALEAGLNTGFKKKILVADGTYDEKVYVETPNLSLESVSEDASKVVIQAANDADSLDALGAAWSTYGSSSVTITSAASGFNSKNITYNNSMFKTMDDYKNAVGGNLQACALVSSADKSSFYSCKFVGFQDTLYANAGNQYYESCSISGMTDYIFGEANNAIFNKCSILSMDRGDAKNGGYICAAKPVSLADTDVGFVFNECDIKGEDTVAAETVSLARPWGANAKVTYMNCTLSGAVSKAAYPCTEHNARWEIMSGNKPTAASFAEYNNSGDGAISEAVVGGKLLSVDEYNVFLASVNSFIDTIKA